jgi:hypothetical protein
MTILGKSSRHYAKSATIARYTRFAQGRIIWLHSNMDRAPFALFDRVG